MEGEEKIKENRLTWKEAEEMNISTKEVNYLKDHLSWELLAAKKCFHHANELQDTNFKQVFETAGRVHQENFVNLLNYANKISREVQS